MPEETVPITFEWKESRIDPLQYKPLAPLMVPATPTFFVVNVPKKFVVGPVKKDGSITLTLDGWCWIQNHIATHMQNSAILK